MKLNQKSMEPETYRVFELLADRADDRQRFLQLGGQLVCVHVPQTQHVAHLETEKRFTASAGDGPPERHRRLT